MEPTINCAQPAEGCLATPRDDELVVRVPAGNVTRGDIVVFNAPPEAAERCGTGGVFVQRIVGLPRDTIAERNGYIYIDGGKLNEPYIKPQYRDTETWGPKTIPEGQYFVIGDNRSGSCDSRLWGTVPRNDLIGVVVEIVRAK